MDKKQSRPKPRVAERINIGRLLWVLGLVAGIVVGAAAAIGIASSERAAMSSVAG